MTITQFASRPGRVRRAIARVFGARRAATVRVGAGVGVALVAALALAPSAQAAVQQAPAAQPAHATPKLAPASTPTGPFSIEITKLEQPDQLQQPANGLPIVDASAISPPVAGATFAAWRVPGIDLLTNEGQQQAAALTVDGAAARVDTSAPPAASDTSDAQGEASLTGLASGLYYVVETRVPTGFVGSAPFLVALPLTNPDTGADWLSAVHVYPKNARVSVSLDVIDAGAVRLGDTIEWVSRSDIPVTSRLDGYRVVQLVDPRLRLPAATRGGSLDDILVGFGAPGAPRLTRGTHYTISIDADPANPEAQRITVDFQPAGLVLLEQYASAQHGGKLEIRYVTEATAEGELVNEALLYPSRAAIDGAPGTPPPPSATAETKWGPIAVRVHERGNPQHPIKGASFELYLSEEDARNRTNPVEVAGQREWTSDAEGMLTVAGLRFSNFANGLDRDPSDPLYRYYYVVPTSFPAGWTGDKTPLRTTVTSATEVSVLEVVLWSAGGGGQGGGGGLPATGGQIAGAAMLAALLLGGGVLLLAKRRRRGEDAGAGAGTATGGSAGGYEG